MPPQDVGALCRRGYEHQTKTGAADMIAERLMPEPRLPLRPACRRELLKIPAPVDPDESAPWRPIPVVEEEPIRVHAGRQQRREILLQLFSGQPFPVLALLTAVVHETVIGQNELGPDGAGSQIGRPPPSGSTPSETK